MPDTAHTEALVSPAGQQIKERYAIHAAMQWTFYAIKIDTPDQQVEGTKRVRAEQPVKGASPPGSHTII